MFDDAKQEFTYAYRQVSQWWSYYDNRVATLLIGSLAALTSLALYGVVFLCGAAALHALKEETMVSVVNGNPCLTNKGLVKSTAPAHCYEDKQSHTATVRTPPVVLNISSAPAYDPPCAKDKLPGCSDKVYGKRMIEGLVGTVTFHDEDKQTGEDHLQPDYTEVKFDSEYFDQEPPTSEKFCGNMLHRFTPEKKIKIIISESKQADYNGCYTVEPVLFTFGGDLFSHK